jgi:hypothetical protein
MSEVGCPVCRCPTSKAFWRASGVPAILFPVEQADLATLPRDDLRVQECVACGHLFQPSPSHTLNRQIYEDLYKHYPFKEADYFNQEYRVGSNGQIAELVRAGGVASSIEIGCNDAGALRQLEELGVEAWGVSPDAGGDHPRLVRARLENWRPARRFDLVISRFSLEHMLNLPLTLGTWRELLTESGHLLVQVPNAPKQLELTGGFIFAHEHIHYFSEHSLRVALEVNGFDVSLLRGAEDTSLIAVAEARHAESAHSPESATPISALESMDWLHALSGAGEPILFGAGLPLFKVLLGGHEGAISTWRVVDDNPVVQGKVIPGMKSRIESPSVIARLSNPVVILTLSSIYHQKVANQVAALNSGARLFDLRGREVRPRRST